MPGPPATALPQRSTRRLALGFILGIIGVFATVSFSLKSDVKGGPQAIAATSPSLLSKDTVPPESAPPAQGASSLIVQRYDPKLEELKKQVEDLDAKFNSALAKARALRREFLKSRPDLEPWEKAWNNHAKNFNAQDETPFGRTLHSWMHGPPIEIRDKIYSQREAEVARVRQYLLPYELSALLDDPETAAYVAPWLQARLQPAPSKDESELRIASGDILSLIGDVLLPDAATLRELLASSNRKQVAQRYTEQKGLGSVDATMPEGAEEYLRQLLRLVILRDATGRIVREARPALMRQHEQDQQQIWERLGSAQRQLREYQAQVAQ